MGADSLGQRPPRPSPVGSLRRPIHLARNRCLSGVASLAEVGAQARVFNGLLTEMRAHNRSMLIYLLTEMRAHNHSMLIYLLTEIRAHNR